MTLGLINAPKFAREVRADLDADILREMLSAFRTVNPGVMTRIGGTGAYYFPRSEIPRVEKFLNEESEVNRARVQAPKTAAKFAAINSHNKKMEPIYSRATEDSNIELFTLEEIISVLDSALSENEKIHAENEELKKRPMVSSASGNSKADIEKLEADLRRRTESYHRMIRENKRLAALYETARRWVEIYERAGSELRKSGVKPKIVVPPGVSPMIRKNVTKNGRISA